MSIDRRRLVVLGAAGLGVLACGRRIPGLGLGEKEVEKAEEIDPPEDLMREHGVLGRLLLAYEECARRIESYDDAPVPEALTGAASIVRRFIEDYHEKLEEDFLFPRFDSAGKMIDVVATLLSQHRSGRRLTDEILRLAKQGDRDGNKKLVVAIRSFVRMYRPHAAREETVLFPAFRSVVSEKEFEALGDQFEDREHELFGKEGFQGIVAQVAALETSLGIYDLGQFTA